MPVDPAETWIFGYGSLMWNPGFDFAEARRARLTGYHRAFCIYSIHYRGTQRRPGLVLGLDRGGVCDGIAFRIAPEQRQQVLAYLRRRELIYAVYREALVPVDISHAPGQPLRTITSIRLSAAARKRISASPDFGSGVGKSVYSSTSGPPCWRNRTAFIRMIVTD